MISIEARRRERENVSKIDNARRKAAKAPVIVPTKINDFDVLLPLASLYAPLFTMAEDKTLLEIATKYDIPLTQEQRLLVETGDTLLPQFEKVEIDTEQQMQLMEQGFAPLQSSNIAAVKIDGADLLILFHSGDVYRYPNRSEMYYPFNEALSPGRLLHRTIRFAKGYSKE